MAPNIGQLINRLTEYADLDVSEFKRYLIDYAITTAEKECVEDKVSGYLSFVMETRAREYLEVAMSFIDDEKDLPDAKYPTTLEEIRKLVEEEQTENPNFYKKEYFEQLFNRK